MEFRRGTPGRRQDRRLCPRCKIPQGTKQRCKKCKAKTAARIEIVWYVDGERKRELTYCWREKDAGAILQRKEEDDWRQQDLGVEREVGGALQEAVDAFVVTKANVSAHYRKQIGTAINTFLDGFGREQSVTTVTTRDVEQYKQDGLVYLSSSTVRSYMLVLRGLFTYLHDEGWIRRNPAKKVKLPPAKQALDHLRPDEVPIVLEACWQLAPVEAPVITALILGGWRKGEIVNLRRRDVYLNEGWAYVLDFEGDELNAAWSPKTKSSRRAVPLHPVVRYALERVEPVTCPDGSVSPWMFPIMQKRKRRFHDKLGRLQRGYGDRRSPGTSSFADRLREVLAEVNIKRRVTIHGLRRTFAVLMQEAGAPDSVIRQALGHGSKGVTELHYLPRREKVVKQWVDAIAVSVPSLGPERAVSEPGG